MAYIEKLKPNLFCTEDFNDFTIISKDIFKDNCKYDSELNEIVYSYRIDVILKDIISDSSIKKELLVTNSTKSKISILKKLKKDSFYGVKIKELNLPDKINKCLKNNNILFISELIHTLENDPMILKCLGRCDFVEIKQKLDKFVVDYLFSEIIECNNDYSSHNEINISENFRNCIEDALKLKKESISSYELLKNKENEIIEKCSQATEDIGIELCTLAYLNPEKIIPIYNSLKSFISFTEKSKNSANIMKNDIDKISENTKNCLLSSCLMAYVDSRQLFDELRTCFKDCEYVYDIKPRINYLSLHNEEKTLKIIKFLNYLQVEFNEILDKIFFEVCSNDRIIEILNLRFKNETFEMIGDKFCVTRERIRQIEKKAILKFTEIDKKEKILWRISAMINGETIIHTSDIEIFLGEKSLILIYLLTMADDSYYTFNKDLNIFSLNMNESLEFCYKYVDELPKIFFANEIDEKINHIKKNVNASKTSILKIICSKYKKQGQFYLWKELKSSLTEIFKVTLKHCYPKGIKLFYDNEINGFKENLYNLFGEISLPKCRHVLETKIINFSILCDNSTYIRSDYVNISGEIINRIDNYIFKSNKSTFIYSEIFEKFKEDLLKNTNVKNIFFMEGVLKFYLKDKYVFTRTTICKKANLNIEKELKNFILAKEEVSYSEIKEKFFKVDSSILKQHLIQLEDIIYYDGVYKSAKFLSIKDDDYKIKEYLYEKTKIFPITTIKLFREMKIKQPEFLSRNNINSHGKLYSILKYMFKNYFIFSKPYIVKMGKKDLHNIESINEYIKSLSIIEISEIIEFAKDNQMKTCYSSIIKGLEDKYIRINKNELLRISDLFICDENLSIIKENVFKSIAKNGYLPVRKIVDFESYPDIGVKWTGFLLKSIVKKYYEDILVIENSTEDIYCLNGSFILPTIQCDVIIKSKRLVNPFIEKNISI